MFGAEGLEVPDTFVMLMLLTFCFKLLPSCSDTRSSTDVDEDKTLGMSFKKSNGSKGAIPISIGRIGLGCSLPLFRPFVECYLEKKNQMIQLYQKNVANFTWTSSGYLIGESSNSPSDKFFGV